MAEQRFEATLETEDDGVFIRVPASIVAALGSGKRPAVIVSINSIRYPSTVAVYKGEFYLPVRREIREKSGVKPGDHLSITLELDASRRRRP